MIKKLYLNLSLIAGLAVLGTSCSKDFLDVTPYGKSDVSTYYSNDNELSLALVGAYSMLNADQLQGWSSPFYIKNLPSDDSNCGGGGSADQAQYQAIDNFDWQPSNLGFKAYYSIYYYGVYRCNQVLSNSSLTSDAAKRMYAEAKFLRAYYFFELTTAFGDVPLRLTNATALSEGMARTPQKDVYAQIEKDLTEAIAVLPNKSQLAGADLFRANKQAAQALLGKMYLYAGSYDKAATTLAQVIAKQGSDVNLISNFADVLRQGSEFGSESLLEVSFVSENKNWGNVSWDRNAQDNRHLQLCGPRDFNDDADILGYNIYGGWGFNTPTKKLYNALNGDPRQKWTVFNFTDVTDQFIYDHMVANAAKLNLSMKAYITAKNSAGPESPVNGLYITDEAMVNNALSSGYPSASYTTLIAAIRKAHLAYNTDGWDQEGLLRVKYGNFKGETTFANGATPELNFSTNWRLIRYADVLLMAAEAYLKSATPNAAQATIEFNKVRSRAGAPTLGVVTFADIVKERQIELAFEGSRFFDLVRWGLAAQELSSLGFKKGTHEHFPIPLNEMVSNPLIGNQNSGY